MKNNHNNNYMPLITIDTLTLVGQLTSEEVKKIMKSHIPWRKSKAKKSAFEYVAFSSNKDAHYVLYLLPYNMYARKYYRAMICTSNPVIAGTELPKDVRTALDIGTWKIKRLDVAYDFVTPIRHNFYIKPANATINNNYDSFKEAGKYNEYVCSKSNPARAIVYDKKKERRQEANITLPYKHLTRFEIRIEPKLIDQPNDFRLLEFDFMKPAFDKFIFCPDIRTLQIDEQQREWVLDYKKNWKWSEDIPRRQKDKLTKLIKESSIDFFGLFQTYKTALFSGLMDSPRIA